MSSFQELVDRELQFARNKFPNMNSMHEGYAVILEELDELWEWIKQKQLPELTEENHRKLGYMYPTRNQVEICKELVQIAAMCQRLFEDVASDGNKVHK